jgi:hypothetical protein
VTTIKTTKTKKPAAQVEPANKAAALKATADAKRRQPPWLRDLAPAERRAIAPRSRAEVVGEPVASAAALAGQGAGLRHCQRVVPDAVELDEGRAISEIARGRRPVDVA